MRPSALSAAVILLLACGSPADRADTSAAATQAAGDAGGCVNPRTEADTSRAAPFAGWQLAEWTWEQEEPGDIGHGVVYPPADIERLSGQPCMRIMHVYEAPDSTSEVAGAIVANFLVPGWTPVTEVWAPRALSTSLVEFAYDESGLPYDSVDATGRWHRVIVGYAEDRSPVHGWAALGDSVLLHSPWTDRFMDGMLYFLDLQNATFHLAPDGPVATTHRTLARGGYDMTAVEARWPWLRVKVEHPGEACADDLPANRRTDHYWIRALDDRGRPRVFYYTRGC